MSDSDDTIDLPSMAKALESRVSEFPVVIRICRQLLGTTCSNPK